eukprot:Skav226344  [mRNA]  locus=scaffold2980:133568:135135:- [translate_table: standard]
MDSMWLCLCGALVMFMHAGFSMLETGSCRTKNASNVLMKNLVNVCVGTIGWWLVGWGLAYGSKVGTQMWGTDGWAGEGFYSRDPVTGNITPVASCTADGCQSTMLSWFFQWAFCTAAATIVSGAVAERSGWTNSGHGNNGTVIGANILMIIGIITWSGISSTVTFTLIKWCGGLRIDEETEKMGMDAKSHSPAKAYVLP